MESGIELISTLLDRCFAYYIRLFTVHSGVIIIFVRHRKEEEEDST